MRTRVAFCDTEADGLPTWPATGRLLSLGRYIGVLGVGLILWSILLAGIAAAQPAQLSPEAVQQIQTLLAEKASRSPAQQKIDSNLLLEMKVRRGDPIQSAVPALQTPVVIDAAASALVDITAEVTDEVLDKIVALGGEVVNSFARYHAIRARMPLAQLEALAGLPQVESIRPAEEAMTHVVNVSQGNVAHRANVARTTFGVHGTGVKICVLSDSVDHLAAVQATGDLPAVTVLAGQAGSGSGEGTAMLEIVHDLAPGATLGFATAFAGQASFAQNIRDLRNVLGCHVLVDDVIYFAEPAFQDGIIAQAVNEVVASGALYFSSAGNEGNLGDGTSGVWEGDFVPIAAPPGLAGLTAHDFGGGVNVNTITVDPPHVITLQWSDPFGGSANDYDLFLLDPTRTMVFAQSTNTQNGAGNPFEQISSAEFNDVGNTLVIIQHAGAANRFVRLNTHRGGLAMATAGQTWGHSAAEGALSIAAVNVATAGGTGGAFNGTESVEMFSSDGPRRLLFNADGTPITPGNVSSTGGAVRQKPDLAAADGVATATPGFHTFFGTSAAAPHAAAIGGLVLSAAPALTPAQVRQALTSTALNIEGPGVDRDSGFGIVDAWAALNAVLKTLTVTKAGTGSGRVTSAPAGINCGTDCTQVYAPGTVVTLTATPASGSVFVGWSGHSDCSDGQVMMDAAKTCTATFGR